MPSIFWNKRKTNGILWILHIIRIIKYLVYNRGIITTNPGSVTLLTKLFGRGIDFVVRDKNMNANRGIHVLQTFLSEELSEETQIKGRTARYG